SGSLLNARAEAPERGWTLLTESMPPAQPASLIGGRGDAPEHGFTLMTESIPPSSPSSPSLGSPARPPITSTTSQVLSPAMRRGLWSGMSPVQRRVALGVGVVLLLFLVIGVIWMAGLFSSPPPDGIPIVDNKGKLPPKEAPKAKQPEQPSEPKPKQPEQP